MNLLDALQEELKRNRELITIYSDIGPAGVFAATAIQEEISETERAMVAGDVALMIAWLKRLRENQA